MGVKYGCSYLPANYTILTKGEFIKPKNGVITYRIVNSTNDIPNRYSDKVIQTAMEIIQNGFDDIDPVGRRITFKRVEDDGDILHVFTPKDHTNYKIKDLTIQCPFPFDGPGGVLAHAFPPGNYSLASQVHYDEDEVFVKEWDKKNIHLLTVAVHETLHALNVGHSNVRDAIMYPTYTGPKTHLHADDLAALYAIYGEIKRNIPYKAEVCDANKEDLIKAMLKYEGIHESSDVINDIVQKYFSWATGSSIAWCGIGLKHITEEAGLESPEGFELARNWLSVGIDVKEPEIGDIAVLWRGSKTDWKGHVGIFIRDEGQTIRLFGGNQKDSYSFQSYNKARLLGYRRLRKK